MLVTGAGDGVVVGHLAHGLEEVLAFLEESLGFGFVFEHLDGEDVGGGVVELFVGSH